MDSISYKTLAANKKSVKKDWTLVDAENQTLGRIASQISMMLKGKNKPSYTPHVDCGDYVVVLNAEKIHLTGNKWKKKSYISHSGHPGGQKTILAKDLQAKHPTRVIEKAVKGMLPKNRLGRKIFHHLYVYTGNHHPHVAQKPKTIVLN